ncbi:MAG: D-aminoacyl-tRNA deacylase [Candidatus Auribacterota bacterium]|jgi:D-tyrosyl-tRNA(Tyr) deacylase|nr:D-aminoacyl-tRNA deacylase [Candidatus Auribacterota bacterium]
MKLVVQRVSQAQVTVDGRCVSSIGKGLLVFLGVSVGDTEKEADYLLNKVINLRIFEDLHGKMNLSLIDDNLELLVISQFTLYGDCRKGRRPSFTSAMHPDRAQQLYNYFIDQARTAGVIVQQGIFGAHMNVSLVNDGPVTFIIESI